MAMGYGHTKINPVKTQFLRDDGKIIDYDVCAGCILKTAKDYYIPKGYEYIGSSNTAFYDGQKSVTTNVYHFFKKIKQNVNHKKRTTEFKS